MSTPHNGQHEKREDVRREFHRRVGLACAADLVAEYDAMMKQITALERPNRSALLRMAANIASGLVQRHKTEHVGDCSRTTPAELGPAEQDEVATISVAIAKAIMAEVDRS